jgi:hypothetical protein
MPIRGAINGRVRIQLGLECYGTVPVFGPPYLPSLRAEMGFIYDANIMKLETDTLYNTQINDPNGGRQFFGLGRSFGEYRFPRHAQRVLFSSSEEATSSSLDAKTREGLSVELSTSFQYQFHRNAVSMASLIIDFGSAAAA